LGDKFTEDCQRLTVDVGPGLLGEQFDLFVSMNPNNNVISLKCEGAYKLYKELADLLDQTACTFNQKPPFYSLTIKGNVYKISALLLQILAKGNSQDLSPKALTDVEKIDRAINIIYNRYDEPLNLDLVSTLCGYSKSNFCKVFKTITGETFHNMLNRHRIDIACLKLKESNSSVEDIALSVGFTDTKSFCRVFKTVTGESSREYKKKYSSR
jgi:AraC-like DNA-binding protein